MEKQPLTLRRMIHQLAEQYPDNESVVDDLYRYTYRELLDVIQRMAKLLHAKGVRKGDRVALLVPPSSSHIIALFGAIELGAIPSALHTRESADTLSAVVERLSPRVLVYDGAYADKAKDLCQCSEAITAAIRTVSPVTPEAERDTGSDPVIPQDLVDYELDFEPMPLTTEETAVIALSSGTTGIPKGIMHRHETLLASARNGAKYMAAHRHATTISIFSTAFIGCYNTTLPFLYSGSKIVFISQWDTPRFLQTIQEEQVTVCFLVPTMWRMLLRENLEEYDLSSLERVGYAGEPMDTATMAQLRENICSSVINTYGTTETGSWGGCAVMRPDDYNKYPEKLESVGRQADGVEIRIVNPDGSVDDELPAGEEGEIIFSGPSVANQLWEQPELSRKIFQGRWWRSGDMGVKDEAGYIFLRGRIDDMIISAGINVLPGQVEETVLSHPAVSECVVIGLPDEKWGEMISAFVICEGSVTQEELETHVDQSHLSGYKKPRAYYFVDELPRGNTGKVSRKLLRERIENTEEQS